VLHAVFSFATFISGRKREEWFYVVIDLSYLWPAECGELDMDGAIGETKKGVL
jgi:hypothetical protein